MSIHKSIRFFSYSKLHDLCYLQALQGKRYIADILVAAGVIAEGSVDQALEESTIGVLISSMFRPGSVRYGQILDRFYVNGRGTDDERVCYTHM